MNLRYILTLNKFKISSKLGSAFNTMNSVQNSKNGLSQIINRKNQSLLI